MNKESCRRKNFFANKMHRDIFFMVFTASFVPVIITTVALFYLIFHITAQQMGFPEAIAYHIIPAAKEVMTVLAVALPVAIIFILFLAYKVAHATIGPFDRIVRELQESIDGKRQGPIILRGKDKFKPLVEKINILLERNK